MDHVLAMEQGLWQALITLFQSSTDSNYWPDSDLIRLNLLGNNVIIVNSYAAATDLLEKRGTTYSERPVFTMLADLWVFQSVFVTLADMPR